MSLKICFISSMHFANDKRVHDKECKILKEEGFKVTHICRGENSNISKKEYFIDGIKVLHFIHKRGLVGRISNLKYIFTLALNQNADVYHCNEVDSWFIGILLKLFFRKKCIFDVHEHYPSVFAQTHFPFLLQPIISILVHIVFFIFVPFTDRIILAKKTVSKDFYCKANKKVLVRNFAPLSYHSEFNKECRMPNSSFTIVHLGLFSKVRGWPQVLQALSLTNNNVNLKIIGQLNDNSDTEFWDTVKRYQLNDRISFFSWMPYKEAFMHLQSADAGLISFQPHIRNHIFAMPHKLFDYMAAGLSVIIPKQAVEVAPIVNEERCGLLVDPSKPAEIADSIKFLFNNPEESNLMGKRGHGAVVNKYNWESESKKLISVYNELYERNS